MRLGSPWRSFGGLRIARPALPGGSGNVAAGGVPAAARATGKIAGPGRTADDILGKVATTSDRIAGATLSGDVIRRLARRTGARRSANIAAHDATSDAGGSTSARRAHVSNGRNTARGAAP